MCDGYILPDSFIHNTVTDRYGTTKTSIAAASTAQTFHGSAKSMHISLEVPATTVRMHHTKAVGRCLGRQVISTIKKDSPSHFLNRTLCPSVSAETKAYRRSSQAKDQRGVSGSKAEVALGVMAFQLPTALYKRYL